MGALRSSQIELRRGGARALRQVAHGRACGDRMATDVHGKVAQSKLGVRQSEAERKSWPLAALEEPFVADRSALVVPCGEHGAITSTPTDRTNWRSVRVALDLRVGQLSFTDWESDRQMS